MKVVNESVKDKEKEQSNWIDVEEVGSIIEIIRQCDGIYEYWRSSWRVDSSIFYVFMFLTDNFWGF